MSEYDARLFDVRVVERNIKKGLITREQYEEHLRSLPDVVEDLEESELVQPGFEVPEKSQDGSEAEGSAETSDSQQSSPSQQ